MTPSPGLGSGGRRHLAARGDVTSIFRGCGRRTGIPITSNLLTVQATFSKLAGFIRKLFKSDDPALLTCQLIDSREMKPVRTDEASFYMAASSIQRVAEPASVAHVFYKLRRREAEVVTKVSG
jgi:hypothetical protein